MQNITSDAKMQKLSPSRILDNSTIVSHVDCWILNVTFLNKKECDFFQSSCKMLYQNLNSDNFQLTLSWNTTSRFMLMGNICF